ncbi:TPA: hypothetical protein ENS27_15300 [bacterium]|nr:hypothetical protein [bacterium]
MKKMLIFIAFFFVITSLCFAQNPYLLDFNFNGDQVGSVPAGGWKATAEGKVEVVAFPSATNKSVKITDVGNGGGMNLILAKPITGKTVTLEFKFMREKGWSVACEIFYIMNQKCPDDWSGICIKDDDGGTFSYHDGASWIPAVALEDGVWHDYKVIMYLDKDKYDIYYDGKEIAKNVSYRKWDGLAGQGIDKFNVANVGDGGSTFVKITAVDSKGILTIKWGEIKAFESSTKEYPNGHRATRFEKGYLPKAYSTFSRLAR